MNHTALKTARFNCMSEINLCFSIEQYNKGNRMALQVLCEDGESYAMLTINMPEVPLAEDEIIVKTYSENEYVAKAAFETGLFENTGKFAGFIRAPIWKVK